MYVMLVIYNYKINSVCKELTSNESGESDEG